MKIDFIDVALEASTTLVGRIFSVGIVVLLSTAVANIVASDDDFDLIASIFVAVPILIASAFGGIGLIILSLLLVFTLAYVRFELNPIYLIIPAILSFWLGYDFSSHAST
jgi:hypothetical protein